MRITQTSCYEYAVFSGQKYLGLIHAIPGRIWASVRSADNELIAFVKGCDRINFGASLLN